MRPYTAPFYFNIKFYLPSHINKKKNSAHIRYIATRPGADRGEIESEYELSPDTPEHHLTYAHERPRSHGLFGPGQEEIVLSDVQKELIQHEGMAWRIIVSLHGDDAKRLNFENRESWQEAIKTQMPLVAAEMGIQESNLVWYAAYHPEVGHPHAHIIFWEKKPKRRLGKVTPYVKNQMRKKFVQHIYREDRDRYGREKTALRDLMKERGVLTLKEAVRTAREYRNANQTVKHLSNLSLSDHGIETNLTSRMEPAQIEKLVKQLDGISKKLPKKGRLMLKFMPADVKEQCMNTAKWIYEQPQFNPDRKGYEEAAEILARPYTQQTEQLKEAVDNARKDMIERIAQTVLKASAEINKPNFAIRPDRAEAVVNLFGQASGHVPDNQREKIAHTIMKRLHIAGLSEDLNFNVLSKLDMLSFIRIEDLQKLYETAPLEPKVDREVLHVLASVMGKDGALAAIKQNPLVTVEERQLKILTQTKEFKRDIETLGRLFKVPNEVHVTIEQMSRVLLNCGVSVEETKEMVSGWLQRSGTVADPEKVNQIIEAAHKKQAEAKEWSRDTGLSKSEYGRLVKRLMVDSPNPYRNERERRMIQKGHQATIAENTFKRSLHQLSAAIKRGEAQREMMKIRAMLQMEERLKRENEEREQGRNR